MKRFKVSFRPLAEVDLFGLCRYIARKLDTTSPGLTSSASSKPADPSQFSPRRGTRRNDIRPGIRTLGFERRASIVFQVRKTEVVIVRIFYGGQDYERALRAALRE